MTGDRSVLYVAASDEDATAGAAALERAAAGLAATPAVDLETVRERAPPADCVVFAETPTTAPGSHLLEVIEAAEPTPVVLFSDPDYRPTSARSTDGIAGYVRRGDGEPFAHLADEIAWVCHDRAAEGADEPDGAFADTDDGGTITTDRQGRIAAVDEWVATVLDVDADGLVGVPLEALATGGAIPESDGRAIVAALERVLAGETDRVDLESTVTPDGEAEIPVALSVRARDGEEVVRVRPRDPASDSAGAVASGAGDGPAVEPAVESDGGDVVAQPLGPADPADVAGDALEERVPLFEAIDDPTVHYKIVAGDPIVRAVNDAFDETFDPGGEHRGANLAEYVRPPGGDAASAPLEEAFASEDRRELSVRLRAADRLREFVVRIVPLPDGTEAVAICTDVTERRHRRRELAIRTDRLEEIADVVRHDLRNSLTLARGYLDLVAETGETDRVGTVETAHERIAADVERLAELTRRTDRLVDREPVALHDAARRAWAAIDPEDATLSLEDDAILAAEKPLLVELLEELFRDAVDRGGEAAAVRVDATENGFVVGDDAPYPADDGPSLEAGGEPPDSGAAIELTAVDRIARAHEWTVSIGEDETGGTRVAVGAVERGTLEGTERRDPPFDNVENES